MAKSKSVTLKEKTKTYHLVMKFNDQVFECDTDSLDESISSVRPFSLKTRIIFTITKDGKTCERIVQAFNAKQLFRSKLFRGIFIQRLIFK